MIVRSSARSLRMLRAISTLASLAVLAWGAACQSSPPEAKPASASTSAAESATGTGKRDEAREAAPKYPQLKDARFAASGRVVAIGDLHGDLAATRDVLKLAGAIDDDERWIGKELTVVQTGDQLDRGDDERAILDLLSKLAPEAEAVGGALVVLNGNHETMNAGGDFRYVTEGALGAFRDVSTNEVSPQVLERVPQQMRDRAAAFFPGGQYAKLLAQRPIVALVGDSLFAHGGVHLSHVKYGIDRINREVSAWLSGTGKEPPFLRDERSPVWSRDYSMPRPSSKACTELGRVLAAVGARRLVVGHTVQHDGVTSACDGRVWRIDVGMSSYYGGQQVMALEIANGKTRVLRSPKSTQQLAPAAE